MSNQPIEYDGEVCLERALKLLVKMDGLCESVIQRILREKNYQELYELLVKSRYNERYDVVASSLYRPFHFDAGSCLSEALICLIELGAMKHEEIIKILDQQSYAGLYNFLEIRIHQYNQYNLKRMAT